jgi:hypothetical protein
LNCSQGGSFYPRDPVLAASAVMGMVSWLLLLFATGRIVSMDQHDALVAEMLEAALLYLTVATTYSAGL